MSDGLTIRVIGEQISPSYIDMTLDSLKTFGVHTSNDSYNQYQIAPEAKFLPTQYRVEGDASGASYLWGIAAMTGGSITINNISSVSAQGDAQFPLLLEKMGCRVTSDSISITVSGKTNAPIDADMSRMPDTAQTLAVIAAATAGTSHLTGLETLRVKETDRIAAVKTELHKLGIKCDELPGALTIYGMDQKKLLKKASRFATYEDHRMAMAFAQFGSILSGIEVEHPQVVSKSYPGFWSDLQKLGIGVEEIE